MSLIACLFAAALSAELNPIVSFLALTGKPTEAELVRKVEAMHADGVDQFVMYGRSGLEYAYMGEDWMKMIETLCREAERHGMKAWLYDEFCFPSGSCNGRITKENREWRLSDMGVFKNADGSFRWQRGYVKADVMNVFSPEATDRFIELTHEIYYRRLKRYFENGTIPAIFTDEPGTPGAFDWKEKPLVQFTWWDGLDADYAAATKGRNLRADVETFLKDKTKAEVWAVYSDLKGRRFAETYFGRIGAWCRKAGIKSTGHLTEELSMVGGPLVQGNILKVLKSEMLPGMDEIFTNTEKGNIEWITLAVAQHAALRNKSGALVELFALGPNDMSAAKMRQMIWLEAIHNVDTYLASMEVMDHLGLKQKHGYLSPVQEGQPWHKHLRLLGDEAKKAARFARKTDFRCEIAVRYPQHDAAVDLYRRHRGRFGWGVISGPELRSILAELRGRQLDCDLVEEAEPTDRKYVFKVVPDGYVEEKSGERFATARAAADRMLELVRPSVRAYEEDGKVADELMVRTFGDGGFVMLNLRSRGNRPLTVDFRGKRQKIALPARGVIALEGGEELSAVRDERIIPVSDDFALGVPNLDRDNLHRLVFDGKGLSKLTAKEPQKGVRFIVNVRPDMRAVELDGQPLRAERPCVSLPVEYRALYRETASVDLPAGEHVLRLARGPKDVNYFLPVAWVAGSSAWGYGEFVGDITYAATVKAPSGRSVSLRVPEASSFLLVRWNGKDLGVRAWAPYEWELPPGAAGTEGCLEIVVSTTVANMLGDPKAAKYQGLRRGPRDCFPSEQLPVKPVWVVR